MRILVACEFSGVVREAFRKKGHEAVSCDLLPSDIEGPHYQGSILDILGSGWDMLIGFPPCTYLAVSGARWFKELGRIEEQVKALKFFRKLYEAPIARICLENPKSIISTHIGKPTQIIQPWQFGHGETKTTCLWLKGLPLLSPTDVVEGRSNRIHMMPQSEKRSRERSKTYQGIADAMAAQWG